MENNFELEGDKVSRSYMDVILFGTGEVGKNAVPFIERVYHILFFADNAIEKWETTFGGYVVKSPDEIRKYNCDVIITSTKYRTEIAKQLEQMGVRRDRLFWCRKFYTNDVYAYEVYPLSEKKVLSVGKPLIQYDLWQKEDHGTEHKKVLIFCAFFSTYTKQLIENMSKRYDDLEFSLLTNASESKERIVSEKLVHIYYFQTMADLKAILEEIPKYDAIQLLWIEHEWAYFYELIRRKARRLNLNVGGSDFYRAEEGERDYKRNLILCADCITAETETTVLEFGKYYGEETKKKTSLLPFGIEVLELIRNNQDASKDQIKKKYNIPADKIVVTCGHNAGCAHQHLEMIDALCRIPQAVKNRFVCVFPMTYPAGCEDYIRKVENRLKETGLEYVVLTKYMDFQAMAEYALISDIMLHLQTTDQLSSTMLEEMYAGSIVIAGKWLPYHSLHKMGIYFLDVDTISGITELLEDLLINIEDYKKKCIANKEIIWKHSSWDELASRWHALWD